MSTCSSKQITFKEFYNHRVSLFFYQYNLHIKIFLCEKLHKYKSKLPIDFIFEIAYVIRHFENGKTIK